MTCCVLLHKAPHMSFIHYIPIVTTLFSIFYFIKLFAHWKDHKRSTYLLWWMIGVFFYGAGTVTESINTLYGYDPTNFKAWYIFGALLGGAPLAQGTVHLLMKKKAATILDVLLIATIVIASIMVIASPLKEGPHPKLTGKILEWTYIRYITPFINIYAFLFLVGGAVYSAVLYARKGIHKKRMWGNILIALGGLLPGIGGSSAKAGYIEVLYITEFLGLCLIYAGYHVIKTSTEQTVHSNQQAVVS